MRTLSLTVIISVLVVFTSFIFETSTSSVCSEQPYCSTVNLTTLLHVCRSFFRVPCPATCGQCASEHLKLKFSNSIDPNIDGKVTVDEASVTLKLLNISLEEALVTEIKELVMDSKAIITDVFKLLDQDKNGIVSITEYINGNVELFEAMGVKIKPEFKETISYVAEIVKISNKVDIVIPKLNELLQSVTYLLGAYPHGLVALSKIQNITNGHFNLERVITTQQIGYSVNAKLMASTLLAKMDRDSDGLVSQSDFIYSLLGYLSSMNVSMSLKTEENLKSYFDIYQSSVASLMSKYGISDVSVLEGKLLPEYDNRPFINLVIPIQEAIQSAKQFSSVDVMRYIRSAANGIPQRKLTSISIIESAFAVADRNKDGHIDIPEFVFFTVNGLPKNIALKDMNEALKVMKLFDENDDDKLCLREFKEVFKLDIQIQEQAFSPLVSIIAGGQPMSMPIRIP